MKRLLLITLLIYSNLLVAGLPPTTLKGESAAIKQTTFNTVVPNNQATVVGPSTGRIETGNSNLLVNPSFEATTYNSGWTCSLGSTTLETTAKTDGNKANAINSIGAGVRCYQTSTTNAANLKGLLGSAILKVKTTDSIYKVCGLVDGNAAANERNCITVKPTSTDLVFYPARTDFYMGGTSNGIVIYTTTTTVQPTVIDDAFVGVFNGGISTFSNSTSRIKFTPTSPNASFGTISNDECYQSRKEDMLVIDCKFTTATPTGSEARIAIPLSLTSQTFTQGIRVAQGSWYQGTATTSIIKSAPTLIESAAAYITFGADQTYANAISPLTKMNGNTVASGSVFNFTARIPIAGWEANTNAAIAGCVDAYSCIESFTAQVSAAGAVSNTTFNLPWVTCTTTSPYTCTFRAGLFSSTPNCTVTPSASTGIGAQLRNNSPTSFQYETFISSAGATSNQAAVIKCDRGADFKPKTVVVSPLQGYVKVPGAENLNVENIRYNFYGINSTTACTSGNCNIKQIGSVVSTVAKTATGTYLNTFPKSYSQLQCDISGFSGTFSNVGYIKSYYCENCNSLSMVIANSNNTALSDGWGFVSCTGSY